MWDWMQEKQEWHSRPKQKYKKFLLYLFTRRAPMQRQIIDFRDRSPLRTVAQQTYRPVSPLRCSPFSKQVPPMSPLRVRKSDRSVTPTTRREGQRVQLAKSPCRVAEQYCTNVMQRTVRSGVGLFQQLANQHKIASEKKENFVVSGAHTNPFEFSERKKDSARGEKNSFAALITNVREIDSIHMNAGQGQLSFKTIQKNNKNQQNLPKQQPLLLRRKNTEPVRATNPFSSPKHSDFCENLQPQTSLKSPLSQLTPNTNKPEPRPLELATSFEDVMLLLRKASQRAQAQPQPFEQQVRSSITQPRDSCIFNMNPCL